MLMRRYPMARMYDGMGMVVEVSNIIHNSRAEDSRYRHVEMTPIIMDPVRREQQMQEVRNAIFVFPLLRFLRNYVRGKLCSRLSYIMLTNEPKFVKSRPHGCLSL